MLQQSKINLNVIKNYNRNNQKIRVQCKINTQSNNKINHCNRGLSLIRDNKLKGHKHKNSLQILKIKTKVNLISNQKREIIYIYFPVNI